MTTRETAEALGVSESTIQRHAKELGLTVNGQQTNLDERAVTIIKTKIERSGRTDLRNVAELPNVSTDLEMMILDQKVMAWKTRRIEELQAQLEESERQLTIAAPKVSAYDSFVTHENFYNFRDAASKLGITQTSFMDYLKRKYIYKTNFGEYRAFGEYQKYFSLRRFVTANRNGNQLMVTLIGLEHFQIELYEGGK